MMNNTSTGKLGEDTACQILTEKKYRVLDRNYRKPWGEIDIIARAPDRRTLVFVEVKALRALDSVGVGNEPAEGLKPEDQMTFAKLRKLKRICEFYCAENPEKIDEERGWRIDVVAIEFSSKGKHNTRHYQNV